MERENKMKKFGLIILSILFFQGIFAQSEANIDKDSILIGDQFKLKLEANSINQNKIIWPIFKDSLTKNIEILSKSPIDTLQNKDSYLLSQEFLLTSFDTGFHQIPAFEIIYEINEDGEKELRMTDPLSIYVGTVEVDTSKAIMPIKGPISSPYTFKEIAPWAFGGLVLVGLIILAVVYYKRRKQNKPIIKLKAKPKLPAHVIALSELDKLKTRKLWQDGRFKLYYTELTDIIRTYLDNRYGIEAMEMTSDEIMDALLSNKSIDEKLKAKLKDTLLTSDLVKFAKQKPLATENDNNWSNMVDFVEGTKRTPQEIKEREEKEEVVNV
ncbi:MAG: hypothetical protein CL663_02920 [Bacteroidetes bacterium]|nr:hypothetical protein [Bacteroidota bacterium]